MLSSSTEMDSFRVGEALVSIFPTSFKKKRRKTPEQFIYMYELECKSISCVDCSKDAQKH